MRTRLLTAMLAGAILSFGMGTTIVQTTNVPVDNQESSSSTKAPGKYTDPPSTTVDRIANTPTAGSEAAPAADSSDTSKPIYKKHRSHKKSGSIMLGGTNSMGGMLHSDVQAGGNNVIMTTGNSYPGSSK